MDTPEKSTKRDKTCSPIFLLTYKLTQRQTITLKEGPFRFWWVSTPLSKQSERWILLMMMSEKASEREFLVAQKVNNRDFEIYFLIGMRKVKVLEKFLREILQHYFYPKQGLIELKITIFWIKLITKEFLSIKKSLAIFVKTWWWLCLESFHC